MTDRRTFIKHTAWGSALFLLPSFRLLQPAPGQTGRKDVLPLDGRWHFYMDPDKEGSADIPLNTGNTLKLPGSLQSQGFGNDVSADTRWWNGKLKDIWRTSPVYERYRLDGNVKIYEFLQPKKHYLGAAWYIKEFEIPRYWKDKRIVLFLERVHWESTVFINEREIGSRMYLGVPHEYDLTGAIKEGMNRLMVRVNNSRIVDVGDMPHSISEQTQGTWNGIVGRVELRATDKVWIDQVQVYPGIAEKKIDIEL
ncbi:MAG: sugar-binding domain-containing protein, partial [Prolixibacteraceae bacterium]